MTDATTNEEKIARSPARAALGNVVRASRAANAENPKSRRATKLAKQVPDAVRAALIESAASERMLLAAALERARRSVARLAGLDVMLGGTGAATIVCPPLLGERVRLVTASAEEVAAATALWKAFSEALAADPLADASAYLQFPGSHSAASASARRDAPAAASNGNE